MHEPKPAGASPVDLSFGLVERLKSLKVLLGTDSPEVRGWAPAVRQEAQAAVNAAISALKQCGGENCMGRRAHGATGLRSSARAGSEAGQVKPTPAAYSKVRNQKRKRHR